MKRPFLAVYIVPLVVVVALAIGAFFLWADNYRETLRYEQTELVNSGSVLMSREMGHIRQTVSYMGTVLSEALTPDQFASQTVWRQSVTDFFIRSKSLSDYISQIRWLSPNGDEVVRINTQSRNIEVVAESELQDKSNRYYFIQGINGQKGEVSLTPIDLNLEKGAIVRPYEVTLRASTKLYDQEGNITGLLVVNYNLNYLFARLRSLQSATNTLELLNRKGQWMLSDRPELEWLHLYGDILSSFANVHPDTWREIENNQLLNALIMEDGRSAIVLPSYLDDSNLGLPNYYFLSQVRATIWNKERLLALFYIVVTSVIGYSLIVTASVFLLRIRAQKQHYFMQLEQEKQRLEVAHAQLQESNHNLVALQQELIEQGKLTSLGLMVAGVGHELNTPLGGMRLSLSSLEHLVKRSASQLGEETSDVFHSTINLALQNLNRAVEVVAQFKRITENQMNPEPEVFNVLTMLEDTISPLSGVLKKYPNIHVELTAEPDQELTSTQGVIIQVLQNLIMNALEHAFENGQQGTISIIAKQEDDFVIEVADNGCGIPEELMANIWEPFVTSGRGKQHSGLGLYMVHQWVSKLLKGHIDVQSSPEGTRFTISLSTQLSP